MNRADLLNLCYSCLIDGGTASAPITTEEAAYTLRAWIDEEIIPAGLTAEEFADAWNCVFQELCCPD